MRVVHRTLVLSCHRLGSLVGTLPRCCKATTYNFFVKMALPGFEHASGRSARTRTPPMPGKKKGQGKKHATRKRRHTPRPASLATIGAACASSARGKSCCPCLSKSLVFNDVTGYARHSFLHCFPKALCTPSVSSAYICASSLSLSYPSFLVHLSTPGGGIADWLTAVGIAPGRRVALCSHPTSRPRKAIHILRRGQSVLHGPTVCGKMISKLRGC